MADEKDLGLPFITRKQLAFEAGTSFSLIVNITVPATAAANFAIRGMTKEGPFTYIAKTTASAGNQQFIFRIPDIPIFLTVTRPNVFVAINAAWVTVSLSINGDVGIVLISGYHNTNAGLSWPSQQPQDPLSVKGYRTIVNPANPGAGNNIYQSVPSNEAWELHAISFQFAADATVANRRVALYLGNTAGQYIMTIPTGGDIVASETWYISFEKGANNVVDTVGKRMTAAMPNDIILVTNEKIISEVTAIQAGDEITLTRFIVGKYFLT